MSGTHANEGRLGKYALRGTLGRGAMGTVYDGWDPAIHRRVAIKTVRLSDAEDEETAEALARFKREAQAAGRLSHPNIVGVFDYGETDEVAYIVMEFVEGSSLKSMLDQERRLPPAEAVEIMTQVLDGLAYSHARGVIHRDIKPANIMVTGEGQVKIADFGIARIESSNMTSVGMMMGTPAYMPPEQFLAEPVDARSDIYAAGVMLFHLLTGERPYEGSLSSIMHKVLNAEAPPRASARAAVPPAFDAVIAKAMARVPAERFVAAGAFSAALSAALAAPLPDPEDDATMMARRPSGAEPATATKVSGGRGKLPILLGGGVLVLSLAAAGFFWLGRTPSKPAPAPIPPAQTDLRPERPPSPQPVSPPAPAVPEPAPRPAPDLRAIGDALAGTGCTLLRAWPPSGPGGTVEITGLSGDGAVEQMAREAVGRLAKGAEVTWSAQTVPSKYCEALDILRVAPDPAMTVTLGGKAGQTTLHDEEFVAPVVTMPGFAAWLRADYLSNDGLYAHIFPNPNKPARAMKPNALVKLTAANLVGPPFGRDMVIAVASAEPLFAHPRSDTETLAHYLGDLQAAVTAARARGVAVSAAAIVVDTVAK